MSYEKILDEKVPGPPFFESPPLFVLAPPFKKNFPGPMEFYSPPILSQNFPAPVPFLKYFSDTPYLLIHPMFTIS